jgi:hypothetical protein
MGGEHEVADGLGVGLAHDLDGQVVMVLVDEKLLEHGLVEQAPSLSNSTTTFTIVRGHGNSGF